MLGFAWALLGGMLACMYGSYAIFRSSEIILAYIRRGRICLHGGITDLKCNAVRDTLCDRYEQVPTSIFAIAAAVMQYACRLPCTGLSASNLQAGIAWPASDLNLGVVAFEI